MLFFVNENFQKRTVLSFSVDEERNVCSAPHLQHIMTTMETNFRSLSTIYFILKDFHRFIFGPGQRQRLVVIKTYAPACSGIKYYKLECREIKAWSCFSVNWFFDCTLWLFDLHCASKLQFVHTFFSYFQQQIQCLSPKASLLEPFSQCTKPKQAFRCIFS